MRWAIPFSNISRIAHYIGDDWVTRALCKSSIINGRIATKPNRNTRKCAGCEDAIKRLEMPA